MLAGTWGVGEVMPENCPIECYHYPSNLECDDCWHREGAYCPLAKMKITEVMTTEERITRLEKHDEERSEPAINRALLKRLQQLEGRMVFNENKLNEHIDASKKKKGGRFSITSITEEKD